VVFRPLQRLPGRHVPRLITAASEHPLAEPRVPIEPWYLRRWHCLPEGYLSARSVRWWDRYMRRLYTAGRERTVAAALGRELSARGAVDVIDIGAGAGSLAARLAVANPALVITASDLSPFCVEAARQRPNAVPVVHADARELPLDDRSVDAVIASHLLGHVPRVVAREIVREAGRVLRPGGRLYTVEHAWHEVRVPGFGQCGERRVAAGLIRVRAHARHAA
jgi:SAM-dependent methyltransferase